jgi:hypothetical protein
MEQIENDMPRELPQRKYHNKLEKTMNIPITKKSKYDNVSREQFDFSSFSNSPPNEFIKFLKQRIEKY